jgi:hypothetical protein
MKKLMLSVSSIVLLGLHVNAFQNPAEVTNSTVDVVAVNKKGANYQKITDFETVQDNSTERTKTFSKSFAIDKNDKINLSNIYGSITIKVWDKNEIKVDVEMKSFATTSKDAQTLIDNVNIQANKNGDIVTYKTEMGSKNGNWGTNTRNGKIIWRREVKVYYTVYMPSYNPLTASQQYGNILIDNYNGATSFKIQYGNLTAGNLTNTNNHISIQYGKGEVKDMGGANIKHQYGSGFTAANVGNLNIDAQYTTMNFASVRGAASIKHQYGGGTKIGYVSGALNINTQYVTAQIKNLDGNLTSKAQYGKLIIDKIEAGKDVDVNAQYTGVSLGFANNYNGDFEVRTQYGTFKYPETVTAIEQGGDSRNNNTSKNYIGQIGKGGAAKVIVNLQYNSLTFK